MWSQLPGSCTVPLLARNRYAHLRADKRDPTIHPTSPPWRSTRRAFFCPFLGNPRSQSCLSPKPSPVPISQETSSSAAIGADQSPLKNQLWKHHMQIIRNLQSTYQISNPAIRALVQQRINDLGGEAFDTDTLGYFLVVTTTSSKVEIIPFGNRTDADQISSSPSIQNSSFSSI